MVSDVCKGNAEFLIDDKTKMPRMCSPGAFISCSTGYKCHKQQNSQHGFCCKGHISAMTEGCPPGEYVYTKKKQIVACDPFNPENQPCPATYSCQYAVNFQRYQCCGKDPIEEEEAVAIEYGCPFHQVAYIDKNTKSAQVCTSSANNCPAGYFCQFSDKNKQFQCCGHKSGCPGESVAYIDVSGKAKECQITVNQCPAGYACQKTEDGTKFQCCTFLGQTMMTTTTPEPTTRDSHSALPKVNTIRAMKEKEKCAENEIFRKGQCSPRKIGDACVLDSQCSYGASCIGLLCGCPRSLDEVDGKCVQPEEPEEPAVDTEEITRDIIGQPLKSRKPSSIPKTVRCPPGQVSHEGKCVRMAQLGGFCVANEQCKDGAECREKRCRCKEGTAGYKGRCLAYVCGLGAPFTPAMNAYGLAIRCVSSQCPPKNKCTFSKVVNDYVCCSTASNRGRITTSPRTPLPKPRNRRPLSSANRCPDGSSPLLYPPTKQPIYCSPTTQCPKGHSCQQNKCCRITFQRRKDAVLDCPANLVQVSYFEDGREVTRCGAQGSRNVSEEILEA
ncbi:hypothetical protein L596_024878 [Steinernema carpocapsae]|uniref:EB domain-containing protein n=1 Tax=Steinernema carpocapsae TaxID=34508 RepID=A0A4U5M639_STECR|nr:hypothetical protein L596_024878 [Steinernema carpocapsae]